MPPARSLPPEKPGDSVTSSQTRSLGKYRLIARLGQGGMAEVFLAAVAGPAGFNKLHVVKLMKPELLEEPEHKAMFLDEGKLAAKLNHPNIVQTHEVQIEQDQYFMAMEYLDGQPLHRILRRAAKTDTHLPLHWHVHFLCEVLAALEYAHDLKDYDGTPLRVVHRDVTPHNVFVTYAGQVKLCDFGIAKSMTSSVETRAGILRGKVAYMAPEQVMGARIDHRADLFAVGVMLWEAVTGTRMWDGQSEIQIMQALSQGQTPAPDSTGADVDPELRQIIARALAPKPDERYASASEFRRALEGFLFSHTARVDPRAVGEWVGKMFDKERANLQAVIQDQMTGRHQSPLGFESVPPPALAAAGADSNPSRSVRAPYAGAQPPASQAAGSLTIPSVEVRAVKPRRTMAAAVGVAIALSVFLAIAVTILVVRTMRVEPVSQTPDVEPVPRPGQAAEPPPSASPTTPPPIERVRIHVTTAPKNAKLELDGAAIDNPISLDRMRDMQVHILRAEAKGYVTKELSLRFDRDASLQISLDKGSGVSRAPAPAPASTGSDDTLPDLKPKKKTGSAPLDTDDPWK